MLTQYDAVVAPLIDSLASQEGAKFAGLRGYTSKASGKVSDDTVIIGADFSEVYRKSIAFLLAMLPDLCGIAADVAVEMIASYDHSLTVGLGNRDDYSCKGKYGCLEVDGETVKGLRRDIETGKLYVFGLKVAECVEREGTYPTPKEPTTEKAKLSREKAKARAHLVKLVPAGRIRTYCLDGAAAVAVRGEVVEISQSSDSTSLVAAGIVGAGQAAAR